MVDRAIKTEEDYHLALNRIEELMDSEENPQRDDELELLAALVEMYEDKEYPIDPPSAIEAIVFRMDQAGLKQKDLIPLIGSKSRVSEILSGKRKLTLPMMRALNAHLGIPADILLQEPVARKRRGTLPRIRTSRI